jgi:NADH-quinone oxidoreductase subunit H
MRLGWKVLVPVSLGWILVIFAIRAYRNTTGGESTAALLITIGIVVLAILAIAFLLPDRRTPDETVEVASDYPVPPLDLEVPAAPRKRRTPVEQRQPAGALSGKEEE